MYGLDLIGIPQISYSATSPALSDDGVYPLFSRTPPSDAFQAKIIKDVICHYDWSFVCTLAGSDTYSSDGIKAFIAAAGATTNGGACPALNVVQTVSFVTGTASVSEEIAMLKSKGCRVVVLFAQATDMKNVFKEAAAQAFTAKEAGVVWFASELLYGSYSDVCEVDGSANCNEVIKGALMVTPNFGPGTGTMYETLADKWHAQTTKDGTPSRDDLSECDDTKDATTTKYLWRARNGAYDDSVNENGACASDGSATGCACFAVNFTDYSSADYVQGSTYNPESSGDGRISTYVPYAYDALITVAQGLHKMLYGHDGVAAVGPAFTGKQLYAAMINATFEGFSGSVSYQAWGRVPVGRRGVPLGAAWNPPSPHGSVTSFPQMLRPFLAGCADLPCERV